MLARCERAIESALFEIGCIAIAVTIEVIIAPKIIDSAKATLSTPFATIEDFTAKVDLAHEISPNARSSSASSK